MRSALLLMLQFMYACLALLGCGTVSALELDDEMRQFIAEKRVVSVGVIADNEPYSSVEGGEVSGFSIDVLNALAERTELTFRYQAGSWPEIYPAFLRGEIDVIDEISYQPDRVQKMLFTEPYHFRRTVVMHDSERPLPTLSFVADLRPYRVGIVRDIYYKNILLNEGVKVVEYDALTSLVRALAFGWVDAIVGPEVTLQYHARRGGFAKIKVIGTLPVHGIDTEDFRLAVGAQNPVLQRILSAGLKSISPAEYEAMLVRWRDDGGRLDLPGGPFRLSDAQARYIRRLGTLRVGFMRDYAPYSFVQGGKVQGLAVDVLQQIEDLTGIATVTVTDRWQVLFDMLQRGEIDLLANFSDMPERRDFTRSTDPYRVIPNVVFTRDPHLMYREPSDLNGKRVALGSGVYYEGAVRNFFGEDAVTFTSQEAMFGALAEGGVDVVLAALHNGQHWMRELGLSDVRIAGELKMDGVAGEDLRFAARPALEPLVRIMNGALAAIPPSERRIIENRWLGELGHVTQQPGEQIQLTAAEQAFLAARSRRLTVCAVSDWMPLMGVGPAGRPDGIAAGFMNKFADRSQVQFSLLSLGNREAALKALSERQCDVMPMALRTIEQSELWHFSAPYYTVPLVLLARVETPFLENFTDLSDQRVGVVKGKGITGLLSVRHPRINFVEMESEQAGLLAVQKGELYGFVGPLVSTSHQLQELSLADIKVVARVPSDAAFAVATRSDAPELASIAQKWVDALTDQDRREIEMRWRAVQLQERVDYSLLWQLGCVAVVLMGLLVAWNRKLGSLNRQLEDANRELERMAMTDNLTGVGNRKYLKEHFEPLFALCQRYGQVFWVAMLDVDHFKAINDTYGHLVGDDCLQLLGACLQAHARRQTDHVVRYGGEEFVAFGVANDVKGPEGWVERLRQKVENLELETADGQRLKFTISVGWVAQVPTAEMTAEEMVRAADDALYSAKVNGRNRSVKALVSEALARAML